MVCQRTLLTVCTACLALELPIPGLWESCHRIRSALDPKGSYEDVSRWRVRGGVMGSEGVDGVCFLVV
jgi:hypothetical protein